MRFLIYLVLAVLVSGAASAQELWRGAHYGDSVPRVLVKLSGLTVFSGAETDWKEEGERSEFIIKNVAIEGIAFNVHYVFQNYELNHVKLRAGAQFNGAVDLNDFEGVARRIGYNYGPAVYSNANEVPVEHFVKNDLGVTVYCFSCLSRERAEIRVTYMSKWAGQSPGF